MEALDLGLDAVRKLNTFNPGIYTLDSSLVFDSSKPLVIAVHPFFLRDDEHSTDYPHKLQKFLESHSGSLVVLSENDRLDQDVMAVYEMGHVANRYFVMTELQDPAIVGMSNKELMGIVNPSNNPIKLIGGFLDKDRSALNRGCLGYFAYCLRRNGVQAEYIPELCFSRSNTIERKLD